MAVSTPIAGPNTGRRFTKTERLRLSDVAARTTTDYAEIIVGDGAPSGGYGADAGATLLYLRKDASGATTAVYVSVNGGTAWREIATAGTGMWAGAPHSSDPGVPAHVFFDDFTSALTADWVVTEDDVACTQVMIDAFGGRLTLTNKATTDDNAQQITWAQESFRLISGKKLWFEAYVRLPAADVTNLDFFVGLAESEDITGVADNMPANGIGFHKDDGDTNIDLSSSDNGTDTQQATVGTIATNTWTKLGFYFNGGASGTGTVTPYINGTAGTAITVTYATMAEMAPFFMVRNGDATTQQIMDIDYVKVVQER